MFKYTIALFWHTVKQIKKIAFAIGAIIHTITVGYLIYTLFTKSGNFIVNLLLLLLSIFSLGYFFYKEKQKVDKKTKTVKRWSGYFQRLLKLYQIVPMFVIILTNDTTNPITFLTVVLSALLLAVGILLDILTVLIEKRFELFKEAIENDVDELKKPLTSAGNFFKKITGQEVEEKTPSKHLTFLQDLAKEKEERDGEQKAIKKAIKKAQKQQAKADKALQKQLAVAQENTKDKNA